MAKCYICGSQINSENESEEHILPNCIGGRSKSKNLLCKSCNSDLGNSVDSYLCYALGSIATRLDIKRESGKPHAFESIRADTGEKVMVSRGGVPRWQGPLKVKRVGLDLRIEGPGDFRDKDRLIEAIRKKLERKNVDFDFDTYLQELEEAGIRERHLFEALENVKMDETGGRPELMHSFELGDKELRAICKIAVSFYLYNKGNHKCVEHLAHYIKFGDSTSNYVFLYYPENEIVTDKNNDEILHTIVLIGDVNERVLYSYIELFSTFKYIVLLDGAYTGAGLSKSYCFDVTQSQVVNKLVDLKISKNELLWNLKYYIYPFEQVQSHLEALNTLM